MAAFVQLRFVNLSDDEGMSNVVFFQKNTTAIHDNRVAWRVVRHCEHHDYCSIPYSLDTDINMVDWNANHSERLAAYQGNVFHIAPQGYGKYLSAMPLEGCPTQIWVQNHLSQGAVHVNLYRSGCLVAQQRNVIPEQWAKFDLLHWLYVAVMPDVKQGEIIPSRFLSTSVAEFCLYDIVSADIIMLGGGCGKDAVALHFEITNVVWRQLSCPVHINYSGRFWLKNGLLFLSQVKHTLFVPDILYD